MINYELVILFYINKNIIKSEIIKKIINLIIEYKGLIKNCEDLGNINLYYFIKNQKKANLIILNIECNKNVIKKLEKIIKYNEFIIRHIIVLLKKN
ncbi:30S ribosomal protein S6 [Candidatus Portiera aleyrodidarum]|uniref:Small ribosomal subunit protein bS6 n=1 Tax=Candidatus Portiera aleyrodidarum TaxID=91844 RepID=A0A8D9JUB6_9GAMM|nr:30S ribosomal protein S6 [Candidatus Portiera aleyrodidarum]CEI58731.1 30S ribosomal protein S6 [Candidatus Portiera aleyrodidarum]